MNGIHARESGYESRPKFCSEKRDGVKLIRYRELWR